MIKHIKNYLIPFCLITTACEVFAQEDKADKEVKAYRATTEKINDLVHTKLDVKFDYKNRYLYGKEWLTLKPHFYATDSLTLDAKGMDIKTVALAKNGKNSPLKFSYDSLLLKIKLDKKYLAGENYTVYIDYTSKPDKFKAKGSQAITDAKGLYFINPDSVIKGKPVQIWTQGETEGSSVWFPTIDKPNQKTTQEISMTVPSKYISLSNGELVSQKKNTDGTRTDTWKMDKPHAPYLFMMAVGDFRIYKDKFKNIPVNYYLEPAYAPYAKDIFGLTTEMIGFFSTKLGIDYPWNKYSQIVVRDFVSGAMENTTATLHGDFVQQTKRELIDGSAGETVIAHELFHQWFGDYVTTESWSNLSVNESFADFSETLWMEYKHGKDAGDARNYEALEAYLTNPTAKTKDLIRFDYNDKEDMFDVVTYQKGGRVLNMLRNYLGEDAFFKGLNVYLKQNAFNNGEAHQLRLAFEQVSGKDLNWFFNQWYFNAGHPELSINYNWDQNLKKQTIILRQTQKTNAFKLPIKIDFYINGKKERKEIWMTDKTDSISFSFASKPDLINVDADKILLMQKKDNKSLDEFAFQYANAPLFLDRFEAMEAASGNLGNAKAQEIIIAALKDKYFELRMKALSEINLENKSLKEKALPLIVSLAKNDSHPLVKAAALNSLSRLKDQEYALLFKEAFKSESYAVQGAALNGLAGLNTGQAIAAAKNLEKDNRGELTNAMVNLYATKGSEKEFPFVADAFDNAGVQGKFNMIAGYANMLSLVNNTQEVKTRIDDLEKLAIQYKSYGVDKFLTVLLGNLVKQKQANATAATGSLKTDLEAQIVYINGKIESLKNLE